MLGSLPSLALQAEEERTRGRSLLPSQLVAKAHLAPISKTLQRQAAMSTCTSCNPSPPAQPRKKRGSNRGSLLQLDPMAEKTHTKKETAGQIY